MRTIIRWLCFGMLLAWAAFAIGRTMQDDYAHGAWYWQSLWPHDAISWAGMALAAAGLALTRRQSTVRSGVAVGALGLIVAGAGYFGGNAAAAARGDLFSRVPLLPERKPNLNKIILGYDWRVPETGGMAVFADGSVRFITKDEFRAAPKAEPPDDPGAWKSPAKPQEPEAALANPDETAAQRTLRLAQERDRIASDLRQFAPGHFYNPPPLNPTELAARCKLDERQQAALNDGTYVWHFGWSTIVSNADLQRDINRLALVSWLGLHLFGIGIGLVVFGLGSMVRSPSGQANPAIGATESPSAARGVGGASES